MGDTAFKAPTYILVDHGTGLEAPKKKREDEPTAVTKLFQAFSDEIDKTARVGEDAVRKARKAARAVRRKGSVQNLKAVSGSEQPPKKE